ncbi:MAG: DUF3857 domain-containing transglutaminase family protein, partial [Bacteroidales bacterium]|nr:DUF3857 domain-containing transglutaminase family protein [Bacteroidales bacterium]
MKHPKSLFIFLTVFFSHLLHAQIFSFESTPAWVKTVNIPDKSSFSKYDVSSGYYLTLADYQVNLETSEYFTHQVLNVVSYSGITNASQLAIEYDTSYQKLKIHHLYVWRKGEKIDRTNILSMEIMNNENNLGQGLYMGQITAYDILDDIRKDDLIDFSYTIEGENPIFDNEKYLFVPLDVSNHIDLLSIRILFLKDRDYSYKCEECDSSLITSETDGYRQLEIHFDSLAALNLENNIPSWIIPYKYFILSSFKSWKEVNAWAQNTFALSKEPELDEVFKEIFSGEENTDEKINKIINYVQDDIRYMGIESGIGSIKPFPPEQVVRQRYGDCKDKSLLMVSLLKKIGVENAWPALVNTHLKAEIGNQFPSNQVFNHCIVTFNYNNNNYWVDPTIAMQGGDFRDLYYNDYEKALIVGKPSDTLSIMNACETKANTNIVEELTVSSFTKPASLKIVSERTGFEADSRRAVMEYFSLEDISDKITKDLKLQFPIAIKKGNAIISDDMVNNTFSLNLNYEVDGFWKDGDKSSNKSSSGYWIFNYDPQALYEYLKLFPGEERKYAFEVNYPLNLNYRMIFHFHRDMLVDDRYSYFENEAFIFDEKTEQLSRNSFQIEYSLRTKTDFVTAEQYKKVVEQK